MKREFTYASSDGRTQIHAIEWLPEGEPKAILQIAHGMVEFVDRYDPFAQYLAEHGFVVTGNDHLGHGQSVASEEDYGFFAEKNGNERVLDDLRELQKITAGKYPGLPYFFLGHSMGSYLARQYIQRYSKDLTGAIIMGTGTESRLALALGKRMCESRAAKNGWHHRDAGINRLVLGSNNKKIASPRTPADWLTKDEAVVDAYLSNPLNTFVFTLNGFHEMFVSIREAQARERIANIRKDLPLLLVSGAEDPVGGYGKGVKKACERYLAAGIRDTKMKLYPGDRHEILNELDRDQVFADLLAWMEERM